MVRISIVWPRLKECSHRVSATPFAGLSHRLQSWQVTATWFFSTFSTRSNRIPKTMTSAMRCCQLRSYVYYNTILVDGCEHAGRAYNWKALLGQPLRSDENTWPQCHVLNSAVSVWWDRVMRCDAPVNFASCYTKFQPNRTWTCLLYTSPSPRD